MGRISDRLAKQRKSQAPLLIGLAFLVTGLAGAAVLNLWLRGVKPPTVQPTTSPVVATLPVSPTPLPTAPTQREVDEEAQAILRERGFTGRDPAEAIRLNLKAVRPLAQHRLDVKYALRPLVTQITKEMGGSPEAAQAVVTATTSLYIELRDVLTVQQVADPMVKQMIRTRAEAELLLGH